jgi:hypothetical protein
MVLCTTAATRAEHGVTLLLRPQPISTTYMSQIQFEELLLSGLFAPWFLRDTHALKDATNVHVYGFSVLSCSCFNCICYDLRDCYQELPPSLRDALSLQCCSPCPPLHPVSCSISLPLLTCPLTPLNSRPATECSSRTRTYTAFRPGEHWIPGKRLLFRHYVTGT